MNASAISPRLLLAAAWVLTAIVAYSIGSLRSTSPDPSGTNTAPGESPLSTMHGIAAAEHASETGERLWDGGHGGPVRTLQEIVGTQSLGDYLKRVLSLEDDIKRTTAFLELLETLTTPEQIREALEAVAKSGRGWGRGISSREYAMLLQKWTSMDPKTAADYALKPSGRDERYMAMSNVLRTWTRLDSQAALAWAQANGAPAPGEPGRQRDEAEGNVALAMVASQLARTDLDLALRAATSDPDSRTMARLGDNLAEELYKQRGEETARNTILAMPEGRLRDTMIGEHADRLAKTDGLSAAKFATSLPPGRAYSLALSEAIDGWAEKDPVQAGAFLNTIPPSKDSDAARERFAREIGGKDPLAAIPWAATITDPRQQQETTERIIRSWVRSDSAAATQWVMQSAYSDEVKQRLLAPETRGRN